MGGEGGGGRREEGVWSMDYDYDYGYDYDYDYDCDYGRAHDAKIHARMR